MPHQTVAIVTGHTIRVDSARRSPKRCLHTTSRSSRSRASATPHSPRASRTRCTKSNSISPISPISLPSNNGSPATRCAASLQAQNACCSSTMRACSRWSGSLADQDAAAVACAVSVNVAAPLMMSAALASQCADSADKRIVHISSVASRNAYPGWSVYCATKAALDQHARASRSASSIPTCRQKFAARRSNASRCANASRRSNAKASSPGSAHAVTVRRRGRCACVAATGRARRRSFRYARGRASRDASASGCRPHPPPAGRRSPRGCRRRSTRRARPLAAQFPAVR